LTTDNSLLFANNLIKPEDKPTPKPLPREEVPK
jgi:hypothetical protein